MDLINDQYTHTQDLADSYGQAQPFPYVVMDSFLHPGVLRVARAELERFQNWDWDHTQYAQDHQVNKFFAPSPRPELVQSSIQVLQQQAPITMSVLNYLRTDGFRQWLTAVTGIPDLVSDDDWLGGGVHRVTAGGALDVHADFNIHWKNKLHRRLNLLIYLNPGWQESWGGALELWDRDLQACQHRILPIFNRAVLFRITDDAYHGHPDPVRAEASQDRLSLAMYYYTQDRPDHEKAAAHGVLWKDKMLA